MPLSEISTAIASIKVASDIARGIISLNKDVAVNEKAAELVGVIISLQNAMMSMQSDYATLLKAKDDLQHRISEYDDSAKVQLQYKLEEIHRGVFVYSLKAPAPDHPQHWLCTKCWEDRKKSILQASYHHESAAAYTCPRCNTTVEMQFRSDAGFIAPRDDPFPNF
ncbi:MAG: hypothetical protein WBW16_11635 [Bacteroidota bacterium]